MICHPQPKHLHVGMIERTHLGCFFNLIYDLCLARCVHPIKFVSINRCS